MENQVKRWHQEDPLNWPRKLPLQNLRYHKLDLNSSSNPQEIRSLQLIKNIFAPQKKNPYFNATRTIFWIPKTMHQIYRTYLQHDLRTSNFLLSPSLCMLQNIQKDPWFSERCRRDSRIMWSPKPRGVGRHSESMAKRAIKYLG